MSNDLKEIKADLKTILENQSTHSTALAVVQTEVKNIHAMGCTSGEDRAAEIFSRITAVDSKHDKRVIAALGVSLLAVIGYVGSIFLKKIW